MALRKRIKKPENVPQIIHNFTFNIINRVLKNPNCEGNHRLLYYYLGLGENGKLRDEHYIRLMHYLEKEKLLHMSNFKNPTETKKKFLLRLVKQNDELLSFAYVNGFLSEADALKIIKDGITGY